MEYKSPLTPKALETRSVRKMLASLVFIVLLIAIGLVRDSSIIFIVGLVLIPIDIGWFIQAYAYESDMNLRDARANLKSNIIAKYHVEDVYYTIKNKTAHPDKAEPQNIEVLIDGERQPFSLTQNMGTFEPFLHDVTSGKEL